MVHKLGSGGWAVEGLIAYRSCPNEINRRRVGASTDAQPEQPTFNYFKVKLNSRKSNEPQISAAGR